MFAGTMWQWNSRRQRNQCVLWPNDMQGKLEKRGKKPTSLNFFSSRTVYITIQTHSLRHGHCIVKPLYLRHDWIKKDSRYQRIWNIEFKIRTGNCWTLIDISMAFAHVWNIRFELYMYHLKTKQCCMYYKLRYFIN